MRGLRLSSLLLRLPVHQMLESDILNAEKRDARRRRELDKLGKEKLSMMKVQHELESTIRDQQAEIREYKEEVRALKETVRVKEAALQDKVGPGCVLPLRVCAAGQG